MGLIEKIRNYDELKQDYELQCIENSRKQINLLEAQRKNREYEEQIKTLNAKIEQLEKLVKEVGNDRKHNTTKQTHSKRSSR